MRVHLLRIFCLVLLLIHMLRMSHGLLFLSCFWQNWLSLLHALVECVTTDYHANLRLLHPIHHVLASNVVKWLLVLESVNWFLSLTGWEILKACHLLLRLNHILLIVLIILRQDRWERSRVIIIEWLIVVAVAIKRQLHLCCDNQIITVLDSHFSETFWFSRHWYFSVDVNIHFALLDKLS